MGKRGCRDGALPHGSNPGPAGHPPMLSPCPMHFWLLISKHLRHFSLLQLGHTRHQQCLIPSKGPDADRRHGASHPLLSLQTGTFALPRIAGLLKAGSRIPVSTNSIQQNLPYTWDGADITLPGCRAGVHEPSLFPAATSISSALYRGGGVPSKTKNQIK